MADTSPPNQGCGRGGRGALLLALSKQMRRPGAEETSSDDSRPVSSQASAPALGRGAYLKSLLASSKSTVASSIPSVEPSPAPSPAPSVGRAAVLAALQGGRGLGRTLGRSMPLSLGLVPGGMPIAEQAPLRTSPPRGTPVSPQDVLVRRFEELKINTLRGEDGRSVNLTVNYVSLKVQQGRGMFEYHVNFNPQIDSKNMRFHLVNQEAIKQVIGPTRTFDGAKLYLPIQLPEQLTSLSAVLPTDGTTVTLHIKFIGQCAPGSRDCIQLYNLLLRRVMHKLNLTLVGRNYFDHQAGIPVPQHKLQVWPGYVTAVDEYQGGLMLNCDASFKVLRDITAKDILVDLFNTRREQFQELFIKQVVGCIVITRYNNKTYRIDDVVWDMNPMATFTNSKGEEVQYKQYYKNAYAIDIKDEKQPMLLHKPKLKARDASKETTETEKMICLVPELCFMTGLTDDMRSDFKVMKDIAAHTRVAPEQRHLTLKKYVERVNTTPEALKVLTDWGLSMEAGPISVQGRCLGSEKVIMGRRATFDIGPEADWGREMCRSHMLVPVPLVKWVVIFTKRDAQKAREFVSMMDRTCPQMGMDITSPLMLEIPNDRTDSFTKAAKESVNPSVQLFVFIFPTSRDDRYSAVKKLCCVEMPVASQVIIARTISQPQKLRSVVQKIGLQINCKLGGELWALPIPLKKTMVIGVDVYHDPTRGGRSVLGFVTSLNNTFTRWNSLVKFQQPGQELADCLKVALTSALRQFHQVNHFLPEKVILFRDGVSDGQLRHVCDYEIPQLESCFSTFDEPYSPSLTVIIVQKRINARMFLEANRGLLNPQPGTVLDHTVTRREWFDFYLVSQHVRQGTVTPTHYVVIHNTSTLKPDHIQKLAYKMTHLYYNWPGTVRVPAPCQYAHKVAYLIGQSVHREPHNELANKLYFL